MKYDASCCGETHMGALIMFLTEELMWNCCKVVDWMNFQSY